jgi:hypothetical protein
MPPAVLPLLLRITPLVLLVAACDRIDDGSAPATPVAISAAGRSVPENVASARVTFSTRLGDSVRVAYWSPDGKMQSTPYRLARSSIDTIDVLGLQTPTAYEYRVEAQRNGVVRASKRDTFSTHRLPPVLAAAKIARVSGGSPSPLVKTVIDGWRGSAYGVVFDTTGRVIWYHDFRRYGPTVTDFSRQPNGNFTAFIGTSFGWQRNDGYYVEITPGGREVAKYHPPKGSYMDPHELLLTGEGPARRAHFFTYTIRTLDLRPMGGKAKVEMAGHQLVRMTPSGTVEFIWDGWEHIGLNEWVTDLDQKKSRTATDYDHPNALTFDNDGNYVVSWRNLNQIMFIHPNTGAVLKRIGGAKGNYRFVDDPLNGFSKQHAVKILPNGNMLLFDNGTDHSPRQSRGVEYQLDSTTRTARLVWQYRPAKPMFAEFVGWIERLNNGNTWVAFSMLGRVVEADAKGNLVWEGQLRGREGDLRQYRIRPIVTLH